MANTKTANNDGNTPEVYVDENYGKQTNEGIQTRTKENCTDVYSRAWCNVHCYQNNRPVRGKVVLNVRGLKCFIKAVSAGIDVARRSTVYFGSNGVYLAPPATDFTYFYCMRH